MRAPTRVHIRVRTAAGGQGQALFVGAVACDLLRRECCDSVSRFQGGWPASSSSLSDLSVIEPSVDEVDHVVPEYTPFAFCCGSVRSSCVGGLCRGAGTVLSMDGGSRLKGVNSLKSSGDLWGLVWWHSRLDPFHYSEPLTNLASYFGARGISDKQANGFEPEPTKYVPSGVAKLCAPEFNLVGAHMREAYAMRPGSIHLPGDARQTHVRSGRHLLFTTRRSRIVESPESRSTGYT
ncbi:hypothetical protein CRG98_000673 [Punica granatum]|uniref:Uncharacterized protein n=1 Tax=Punica granatum TaxID=22663 RepID=A0A2I0LE53_PUNGR|nr:hypothetical protein CRG98_000673 [Punica granatum]